MATTADTMANILKAEPNWTALPKDLPGAVRDILHGCLQRDRKQRIGDFSTIVFSDPVHVGRRNNAFATPTVAGRARR